MPTITLNKKVLEKSIGKNISLEKLKDRISYLGTDLNYIKSNEINVEVFPNRPDMLSEQGFARALASFIGTKTGLKKYTVNKSGENVIIEKSVKDVRPYTACAIVKGLKLNKEKIEEIIQIQEKLHITYGRNRKKVAIGIYPFEKIKTPIRFLALPPEKIKFKPLDFKRELTAKQILSQHQAGRNYGYLLEGCKKYPIFIDTNNKILSMPPVINSEDTGKITKKTKDVFIECSGFDFNVLSKCLNIIVTALADMDGKVYSMQLSYGNKKIITPNLKPDKMNLNINYANKILGLNLKEKDIKKYLERMGYDYNKKTVLIPCYRIYVLHQRDLIEDIAIAYGYENFKEEIPNISTIGEQDKFESFKDKVANLLIGFNLIEVSNYHLTNEKGLQDNMLLKLDPVKLENSKTEYNLLRTWLIPGLLKTLSENKHYDYPQRIFEIGAVFKKNDKTETRTEEFDRVAMLTCHSRADYTEAKQILDSLLSNLGLNYKIEEAEHPSFIPGRVARVTVKGKKVAYLGEIHPQILSNFNLEMPVSGFELNLSDLFSVL